MNHSNCEHALNVSNIFKFQNLGEYHSLLVTDVLL